MAPFATTTVVCALVVALALSLTDAFTLKYGPTFARRPPSSPTSFSAYADLPSAAVSIGGSLSLAPSTEVKVVASSPAALGSSARMVSANSIAYDTMYSELPESFDSSLAIADSLSPRKKPTKEEVDAKNKNLALWFWGGGFVAPFLATFYYFGFKFWEK